MATHVFRIPIEPKAQKRDRIAVIGGHARSYKDAKQNNYEAKVRALISEQLPAKPLECPLVVEIMAFMPIPQSWSKKKKELAYNESIYPQGKPDVDNLAKQVFDIFNGLVWNDDKQVVKLTVSKDYSDTPEWFIRVMER